MREIEWIEAKYVRHCGDTEVSVRLSTNGKGVVTTRVTFYGSSLAKITRREHIRVGMSLNRMYFQEAQSGGYKVSKQKSVRIPGKKDDWVGEYKLMFDGEMGLWYIQKGVNA